MIPRVKPSFPKTRLGKGSALGAALVVLVGGFEGLRTAAYADPVGIPTICFGSTKGVRLGQTKTVDECKALLTDELIHHEQGMRACLRDPDGLPAPTYGAFVSFTFNVGVGAFCKSTLARKANAGDLSGACNELLRWDRAGGVRWPGLTKRRKAERDLCLKGIPT
jgi:lysozyme